MTFKMLPNYLSKRYRGWHATTFEDNKAWFGHLANEGQRPRSMIISCCDSRLQVSSMFEADTGEFFIHRNIANLVPPYRPDNEQHGTSAAIEYAVEHLKVAHILLVGHSNCGGIEGGYDLFHKGLQDKDSESFVNNWLKILAPSYEKMKDCKCETRGETLEMFEKESIVLGLNNLMSFPFVSKAVEEDRLSLHGLWVNIGSGVLECYESEVSGFTKLI